MEQRLGLQVAIDNYRKHTMYILMQVIANVSITIHAPLGVRLLGEIVHSEKI
jgi:hypothetical protein